MVSRDPTSRAEARYVGSRLTVDDPRHQAFFSADGAAEASGVPTLKLKLIATVLSGALMGMAGAPLPYYITYLDPSSAFNLALAVNSIAMPMVGGTVNWIGPVLGAVFLATVQQVATVTISSALNLLFVGVILVSFVVIAPNGIIGWFGRGKRRRQG